MAALKIGICVTAGDADLETLLWSNSVGQRIVFLIMLFKRLECVGQVVLVSCPAGESHPLAQLAGVQVATQAEALADLDIIIEISTRSFDPHDIYAFRARGGKLVSYIAGNVLASCFEEFGSNTPNGDIPFLPKYDAAWVENQHWAMCHAYAKLVTAPLAEPVPHIWTPHFVDLQLARTGANAFFRPPGERAWCVGVFDPNVNVTRTFQLPLLVAEEAARLRPDLISGVRLFNAFRLRDNRHLLEMFDCMDLGRDKKVTVETRHPVVDVMGQHIDAVISHQWNDPLHYHYWEVLYLGWPLVHNSTVIQDLGYYFPEFDPQAGGRILAESLEGHAGRRDQDREKLRDWLWRIDIDNPVNLKTYTDRMERVMSAATLSQ